MYQYELSGQYFDVLGKGAIAVDLIFCVATLHYFLRILIIKYSCWPLLNTIGSFFEVLQEEEDVAVHMSGEEVCIPG